MEKISNKVLLIGVLAIAIVFSGCKKYEDGPWFSLLTKKQRVTGEWEATKLINNDSDMPGDLINYGYELTLEFEKDGDFTLEAKNPGDGFGTMKIKQTGDWEFSNDKEYIEMDYDPISLITYDGESFEENNSSSSEEWYITRLTNKEFEAELTHEMKKRLFPKLLNSKYDVRIECEKQ